MMGQTALTWRPRALEQQRENATEVQRLDDLVEKSAALAGVAGFGDSSQEPIDLAVLALEELDGARSMDPFGARIVKRHRASPASVETAHWSAHAAREYVAVFASRLGPAVSVCSSGYIFT